MVDCSAARLALMSDPLDHLALLQGRRVLRERLAGGMTNLTWRVRDLDDPAFDVAVRIAPPSGWPPAHSDEVANHRAAATVGVAPDLLADEPGLMVVAMVPGGVALTGDDLGQPATIAAAGRLVRQLHDGPACRGRFDLFEVRRRYLDRALRAGRDLDRVDESTVRRIEARLATDPAPQVPCHNDLVAANIIDDTQRLWLIDFEYAAMGEAAFDLGNLWIQSPMTREDLDTMVKAYSGRTDPELVTRAELWGVAAGLTWPLWASVTDEMTEGTREWVAEIQRRARGYASDAEFRARLR